MSFLSDLGEKFSHQSFAEKALEIAAIGVGGYYALPALGGLGASISGLGASAADGIASLLPGGAAGAGATGAGTAGAAATGAVAAPVTTGVAPLSALTATDAATGAAAAAPSTLAGIGNTIANAATNPWVYGPAAAIALTKTTPKTVMPNAQTTPTMQFTGAGGVHYPTRPAGYAQGGITGLMSNPNPPMSYNRTPAYNAPSSTPMPQPVMMAAGGSPYDQEAQYLQAQYDAQQHQLAQQSIEKELASQQGLMPGATAYGYAGGEASHLGSYSDGGRMLKGPGDGMSDSIPANIGGKQPARLANDEFVVPADVVSHLGNGSSDAGAKRLYGMMDRIRRARTGNPKQAKAIHPERYMPG